MSQAVEQLIETVRRMAVAPRSGWLGLSQHAETLAVMKLGAAAPPNVQALAAAVKGIARQMPHAHAISEIELRGIAQALANVLANELAMSTRERDRPFYTRTDR